MLNIVNGARLRCVEIIVRGKGGLLGTCLHSRTATYSMSPT
jgi:hypothetical protein